eukprot:CAMPEP_0118689512 /NCGR_PEP_ID=MMETSP0800-20121206/9534_1 /TAXON_ID=210618 ORGANISM="Striatella unipunctata, Strain CCMP2910" /NCGR_SAMPLE_ID=MMETSP0800 /ASSEMBLY_ACC=CAM_ASM_000638 /LENGTH=57 /DNA_ID=CAMNT_0006586925 /DNA_START=72 /DNA_END=245 /DNA_ORIENTATION=-
MTPRPSLENTKSMATLLASLKREEEHYNECSNYMMKMNNSIKEGPISPEALLWEGED